MTFTKLYQVVGFRLSELQLLTLATKYLPEFQETIKTEAQEYINSKNEHKKFNKFLPNINNEILTCLENSDDSDIECECDCGGDNSDILKYNHTENSENDEPDCSVDWNYDKVCNSLNCCKITSNENDDFIKFIKHIIDNSIDQLQYIKLDNDLKIFKFTHDSFFSEDYVIGYILSEIDICKYPDEEISIDVDDYIKKVSSLSEKLFDELVIQKEWIDENEIAKIYTIQNDCKCCS